MTLSDSTIEGNSAASPYGGGGIYSDGTLTVTDCTIDGNSPMAAAASLNGGTLSIIDSTIAGNNAGTIYVNAVEGGGIANYGTVVTVTDSTISGNTTTGGGGGIYNDGTITVTDSTIADNQSGALPDTDYGGGGINNQGTLTAVNTTIAYNYTRYPGGGVYDDPGCTTTLYNTIVAVNTAGDGADDIAGAGVSSASAYNLVGVDETGSLTNGTDGNLIIGATNPGLGLLAYNGGPTQTIALLAGSPAIDAGSNALANEFSLTTDQRGTGFPRIVNGIVDIGAFERPLAASIGPATVYTVDLTSDTGASTGADAGDLAYVIGQADLNPNLAGSVIEFAPTVFGASNPQTITLTSTLELGEPSGPMVIDGPGAGAVTISGGNAVGVFQVEPGAVVSLSGLTISGGSAANGGGIDVPYGGTLTVAGSTITGNSADYTNSSGSVQDEGGGGIYNGGILTVTDCVITDNSDRHRRRHL